MMNTINFLIFAALSLISISGHADEPLERLKEGNKRYVEEKSLHPNRGQERRTETKMTQTPFAVIVTCSDSRVAPEILFDQGISDLFVVRLAGNVVGPLALESLEFAALYLNTPLVVVMGHKNCGAVDAVIKQTTDDVLSIAQLIEPAVEKARASGTSNLLERATKLNAEEMAAFIRKSSAIKKKGVKVVSAYYNIETGQVEWL